MNKKKLCISFSGGRTSAYMTKWLYDNVQDEYELLTVFANTGKEREETLQFVDECSKKWSIPIVWLEATHFDKSGILHTNGGWGVKHRIVDFNSASRNGQPFEEMINALGIPNVGQPFCSEQLKKKPINHFRKTIGWRGSEMAIGIRCDEIDRVSVNHIKERIKYPLVSWVPTVELQVLSYWAQQSFDLGINSKLGNCDGCWKKSRRGLVDLAINEPTVFDWWQDMTDKYSHHNPHSRPFDLPNNFYRGNHSPQDIFKQAELSKQQLNLFAENEKLDGCSESCEAF
jgi:3'-phosphoadenosine 5'-phosphosulfate sulfotransferase (PAPS reductase)/FAD synthetase